MFIISHGLRLLNVNVQHTSLKPEELGLNATFKQKYEHAYLALTLQNRIESPQSIIPSRLNLKLGYAIQPDSILGTAFEYLSGNREGKLSAEVSADPFDLRKSQLSLRATQKLSRTVESTVRLRLSEADSQIAAETHFELKFGLGASKVTGSQARLYFGWSNSLEGGRLVLGMKIAGVKFKFPY